MKKRERFPRAIDPARVGRYPGSCYAGGGFVWDAVLEYRVWCHPERGAPDGWSILRNQGCPTAVFRSDPGRGTALESRVVNDTTKAGSVAERPDVVANSSGSGTGLGARTVGL